MEMEEDNSSCDLNVAMFGVAADSQVTTKTKSTLRTVGTQTWSKIKHQPLLSPIPAAARGRISMLSKKINKTPGPRPRALPMGVAKPFRIFASTPINPVMVNTSSTTTQPTRRPMIPSKASMYFFRNRETMPTERPTNCTACPFAKDAMITKRVQLTSTRFTRSIKFTKTINVDHDHELPTPGSANTPGKVIVSTEAETEMDNVPAKNGRHDNMTTKRSVTLVYSAKPSNPFN